MKRVVCKKKKRRNTHTHNLPFRMDLWLSLRVVWCGLKVNKFRKEEGFCVFSSVSSHQFVTKSNRTRERRLVKPWLNWWFCSNFHLLNEFESIKFISLNADLCAQHDALVRLNSFRAARAPIWLIYSSLLLSSDASTPQRKKHTQWKHNNEEKREFLLFFSSL